MKSKITSFVLITRILIKISSRYKTIFAARRPGALIQPFAQQQFG
jgi:hypothetical protein